MLVVNWNIRQGGGNANAILESLKDRAADLIVLTEFRNNMRGNQISSGLNLIGYRALPCSSSQSNKNGVGVFSKEPIKQKNNNFGQDGENVITFDFKGYVFIAAFCADDGVTKRFIDAVVNMSIRENTIIIGDLNTGPRGSDPKRYKDLDRLGTAGFANIWRLKHTQPFWSYQSRAGKSQPDHVLCNFKIQPATKPEEFEVSFDAAPIDHNSSDHAIMIFEFNHHCFLSQA